MLPALLFGAGAVMQGIYSVGQALDNNRYWADYYKNTGVKPRYPWRAGKYDWLQSSGATLSDSGFAYSFGRRAYRNYRYRRYW